MLTPLPRASNDDYVKVPGFVWNDLVERLERMENFTADAPLFLDRSSTGNRMWYRGALSSSLTTVIITSIYGSCGGIYNGKTITVKLTAPSGSLSINNVGTLAASENCKIWNYAELTQTTHAINLFDQTQTLYTLPLLGTDVTSKLPVYALNWPGAFSCASL